MVHVARCVNTLWSQLHVCSSLLVVCSSLYHSMGSSVKLFRKPPRRTDGSSKRVEERLIFLFKRCSDLKRLQMVHAQVVKFGLHQDVFVASKLILFCVDAASSVVTSPTMDYALSVFNQMDNPDGFIWNTMIRGFGRTKNPIEAIVLYQRMQKSSDSAVTLQDNFTFSFLLKICGQLALLELGEQVHSTCVKHGLDAHAFVRNTLVHMYAMCKCITSAQKAFSEMVQPDLITWNAIIDGCLHCDMPEDALIFFQRMQKMGIMPDEITLVVILSACAKMGALGYGRLVHSYAVLGGYGELVSIRNSLVDMYAKCGQINDARQIFDQMLEKNEISWNAMIQGLAIHGHAREALRVFSEMESLGKVPPNSVTFLSVLCACSHAGLVDEAKKHFNGMVMRYGISPGAKHYGSMIDLLGRAGFVDEAYAFIQRIPGEYRNAIMWRTLLGACRVHGKVELAEHVRRHLLHLEPDHSGDYVLLSNMYATKNRWKDVVMVRQHMRDRGVQKPEPGNSLIDLGPILGCCM
ncbi:pentatricopeptide repeat-containing protein At4g21065-like [Nymphaea colorata]|uniref:pentatricopeptide repeat-containing protein At4g21065-like n=1 Tax=Nymphaea colorata TaxID=210225 RepID=UPI00129E3EA9|nr:pentatricopeptide repeat-containing protein At4g21065-like [Nymphaea colorata]